MTLFGLKKLAPVIAPPPSIEDLERATAEAERAAKEAESEAAECRAALGEARRRAEEERLERERLEREEEIERRGGIERARAAAVEKLREKMESTDKEIRERLVDAVAALSRRRTLERKIGTLGASALGFAGVSPRDLALAAAVKLGEQDADWSPCLDMTLPALTLPIRSVPEVIVE